jgi:hypothetical protein
MAARGPVERGRLTPRLQGLIGDGFLTPAFWRVVRFLLRSAALFVLGVGSFLDGILFRFACLATAGLDEQLQDEGKLLGSPR